MRQGLKRRLLIVVSLVVGVGLFLVILSRVDLNGVWQTMVDLGPLGFFLSFLNIAAMVFGWAWGWKLLLDAYEIRATWSQTTKGVLCGFALGYLTPSAYFGGEPLRIYYITKEASAPSSKVTATVVLWKLIEGFAFVSFLVLGSAIMLFEDILPRSQELLVGFGIAVVLGIWGVLVWGFVAKRHWFSRLCGQLRRWFPLGRQRLRRLQQWFLEAELRVYEATLHHRGAMVKVVMIGFLITVSIFIRPLIFFYFSGGIVFSLKDLALIFSLYFFLSSFLWLTPGGIGLSELGLIGIFQLVAPNIPASEVVAYALLTKGIELSFVALGLIVIFQFGWANVPKANSRSDG